MVERYSCRRVSLEQGEPMAATASVVRRWIVVEQPGPWGRDAVTESRLPAATAEGLLERGRELGARVILIRRHGRDDGESAPRTCYVATTGPRGDRVEELVVDTPAALLERDLSPLAADEPVGGRLLDCSPYLVCTNGSHDACCAEYGRPVAKALASVRPELTWECSHIGGDRFAGNLLALRGGFYFGRLTAETAVAVVERFEAGELDLEHLRGRAGYPFVVQAAEQFLRREAGLTSVDAVVPIGHDPGARGGAEVVLATRRGRARVTLTVHRDPPPWRLTCQAEAETCPPSYELVAIAYDGA